MPNCQKQKILIKISGGCLKTAGNQENFDPVLLDDLVNQIVVLTQNYQVGLVIGGGNIWRGKSNYLNDLHDQTAHYVGMLATIMNGLVIQSLLSARNIKSTIFSGLNVSRLTNEINHMQMQDELNDNKVLIFTGGTGMPYLSTDTAAAIRAIEMGSDLILMGKDNVKGVYDKDPKKHADALFYSQLTYDQIIAKNLEVMDCTALTICKENNVRIFVFNQAEKNCFLRAINDEIEMTKITNK